MDAVFRVRGERRAASGGGVHVDGTCRIQSVRRDLQPFYANLIQAFAARTGVPMLINTSFNDQEPLVRSEDDALRCFGRGEIDHLVLGDEVISREPAAAGTAA